MKGGVDVGGLVPKRFKSLAEASTSGARPRLLRAGDGRPTSLGKHRAMSKEKDAETDTMGSGEEEREQQWGVEGGSQNFLLQPVLSREFQTLLRLKNE